MPSILPSPESSWDDFEVSLSGIDYSIEYQTNTRDDGIRFNLYQSGTPVITGIRVMYSNKGLLSNYNLDLFSHGDIFCVKNSLTTNNPTQENLSTDFSLVYYTNEELDELGVPR